MAMVAVAAPPMQQEAMLGREAVDCYQQQQHQQHEEEEPWWKDLLRIGNVNITSSLDSVRTVKQLSRYGYNGFFQEKLSKEVYFQICIVVWLVQLTDEDGQDPQHLWKIVEQTAAISNHSESPIEVTYNDDDDDDASTTSTTLPSLSQLVLPSSMEDYIRVANNHDSHEHHHHHATDRLVRFFLEFYKECEQKHTNESSEPPTKKRRRMTNHLLGGRYQLPTAYLLTTVLYHLLRKDRTDDDDDSDDNVETKEEEEEESSLTWPALHSQVCDRLKSFKSMTSEDIHGGLAILGLELLKCGTVMEGLTPKILLENYISRMGESVLFKLKDTTGLDSYWLRAYLSDHLLEPIFANTLPEAEQDETIHLCLDFLNKEQHPVYLQSLHKNTTTNNDRSSSSLSSLKGQPLSYPVLKHLGVWLLCDNLERAMQLVRNLEACPYIDEACKDYGWLHIWQHLLRQGYIFLDGNIDSPGYYEKREFLYNTVISGMCAIGREATKAFFEELAAKVYDHPAATAMEKEYVLRASQQSLLRIFFKCLGLGAATIRKFLTETTWPVPISTTGALVSSPQDRALECWAEGFLKNVVPIPDSIVDEEQILDLERLIEKPYEQPANPSFLQLVEVDEIEEVIDDGDGEIEEEEEEEDIVVPDSVEDIVQVQQEKEEVVLLDDSDDDDDEEEEAQPQEEEYIDASDALPRADAVDDNDVIEVISSDGENEDTMNNMDDYDDEEEEQYSDDDEEEEEEEPEGGTQDDPVALDDSDHDEIEEVVDQEPHVEFAAQQPEVLGVDGDGDEEEEDAYDDEEEEEEQYSDEDVELEGGTADEPVELDDSDDDDDDAVEDIIEQEPHVEFAAQQPEVMGGGQEEDVQEDAANENVEYDGDVEAAVVNIEATNDEVVVDEEGTGEPLPDATDAGEEDIEVVGETMHEDEPGAEGDIPMPADDTDAMVADASGEDQEADQTWDDRAEEAAVAAAMQGFTDASQPTDDTKDAVRPESPTQDAMGSHETASEQSPVKSSIDYSQDAASEQSPTKTLESASVGQESLDRSQPVEVDTSPTKGKEPPSVESIEDKVSTRNDGTVDSDATDDEQERALEVEKAETEVAAVGGEFGDTTEEEGEDEDGKANRAAMANRTADLRASMGYASQLEEGYEPEDTHGYTEEEVSEAIHTEDEEEDRRRAQESRVMEVEPTEPKAVSPVPRKAHSNPHSSDDMDAADEHTEPEEDLGAESSELEESTEVPRYSASFSPSEHQGDPKALWEYAQTAQRQHEAQRSLQKAHDEEMAGEEDKRRSLEPVGDKSVGFVDPGSEGIDYSAEPYGTEGSKSRDSEPTESDRLNDPTLGANTESETNDESKATTIARKAQIKTYEEAMETDNPMSYSPKQSLPTIQEDTQPATEATKESHPDEDARTEKDSQTSDVAPESTEAVHGSVVDSNHGDEGAKLTEAVDEDKAAASTELAENNEAADETGTPSSQSGNTDGAKAKTPPSDMGAIMEDASKSTSSDKAAPVPSPEGRKSLAGSSQRDNDDDEAPTSSPVTEMKTSDPAAAAPGRRLFDEDSEAQADKEDNSVVSDTSVARDRSTDQPEGSPEPSPPKRKRTGKQRKKDPPPPDAESETPLRSTRSRKKKDNDDDVSVASSNAAEATKKRAPLRKSAPSDVEDDDSVASSTRRATRQAMDTEDNDSISSSVRRSSRRVAARRKTGDGSIAGSDNEKDDDNDSVTSSVRRSARAKSRAKPKDDDGGGSVVSSVASSRRSSARVKSKKTEADSGDESIATGSVASRTRRRGRQSEADSGDESIASASLASRTRRGATKKAAESDADSDDDSIGSASVTSVASRTRRGASKVAAETPTPTKKRGRPRKTPSPLKKATKKEAESNEPATTTGTRKRGRPAKKAGEAASRPPLPPQRTSGRVRKKKVLD